MTADRSTLLSLHSCRPAGAGDSVSLCQFVVTAVARCQPVPGNLQPSACTDAHHAWSRRALYRGNVAHIGYSSCAAGDADAHGSLQRPTA